MMIYEIFVKHTLLFFLGAHFFVYFIDVSVAQYVHAHECAPNF